MDWGEANASPWSRRLRVRCNVSGLRTLRANAFVVVLLLASATAGCSYNALVERTAQFAGWASDDAVAVREIPRNPLATSLQVFSTSGPKPTQRTLQVLRRYDLDKQVEGSVPPLLEKFQSAMPSEPDADHVHALAELAYIGGKRAELGGDDAEALDLYGAAVAQSYFYLFDKRLDSSRNPYDPHFRRSCDLYNVSLEAALRLVQKKGGLRPGTTHRIDTGRQQYEIKVVAHGAWHEDDFDRFEFVSNYQVQGLANTYHTYGLGVPLIGIRKRHKGESASEQFYPEGLTFPVTALLRVHPERKAEGGSANPRAYRVCALELHDPLMSTDVTIGDRVAPLEADLTTPIAYFLDQPKLRGNYIGTYALLRSDEGQSIRGVYMMEPYDPKKIPVILVHGLWSSPITWMEMFNDLRAQAEIRNNYQFWFYLYPTGQPFYISAAQMRYDLAHMRNVLDPQKQAAALDQTVLVGHSMGGLVSKLQAIDSGDEFWHVVSEKPFSEMKGDAAAREKLRRVVYFEPNPSIRRVITIATPHHGSKVANDTTRWIGRSIITLPAMFMQTGETLVRDNPNFFRRPELLTSSITSIDSLAPDSPFFAASFRAQPGSWVKFNNIVGKVSESQAGFIGSIAGEGDGVVDLKSAHFELAESEVTVPAEHSSVHRHPKAVLEVMHILQGHLREALPVANAPPGPTAPIGCDNPNALPPVIAGPALPPYQVPAAPRQVSPARYEPTMNPRP